MIKAILFDLDDTLLDNKPERFLPPYFQALSAYVAHLVPPARLVAALQQATGVMLADHDRSRTNADVFWEAFVPLIGHPRDMIEPVTIQFYEERFNDLARFAAPRPAAPPVVQAAFDRGLRVVIATNPLFPRRAIEHRLAWANVPVTAFPYDLVTTYENMHTTKPQRAYYDEIAARLGLAPAECLMVGDDPLRDVAPAQAAGMPVFWVNDPPVAGPPPDAPPTYAGSLDDVRRLLDRFGREG